MKKKIFIPIGIILLIVAIFCAINLGKSPISSKFVLASHGAEPQQFIAHRGFSSVYPENTLPAIEGAIENDFYGVEFDIHTTKDGVWILNHDTTIDKMTDGSGEIAEMTFDELQQFTIDNGNGIENYKNLKLPKFEDALKLIKESTVVPYIEIKGYDPVAFQTLIDLIDNYGFSDKAVIISFDMEALFGIREIDKDIKLMFITNELTMEDVNTCLNNGNIGIDINGGLTFKTTKQVKFAQENGLDCAAWTVDLPVFRDLMNAFGITKITTNRIKP